MKPILFLLLFLSINNAHSQISSSSFLNAKEYNKDLALFEAKRFLFTNILKDTEDPLKFEVIPLASAYSGELTTLLYKCEERNKEGLVLAFYGSYWNDNGVIYTGYGFKHFDKVRAAEFLKKLKTAIESHIKYLKEDPDNNNIVFKFDDIDILISHDITTKIRLFWNNFDSTWEKMAFERSLRGFDQKKSK